MTSLDQQILDTAKEIDSLKAKPMGGSSSKKSMDMAPVLKELTSAKLVSKEQLASILSDLFPDKSPEEVATLIAEDSDAREKLLKAIAELADTSENEMHQKEYVRSLRTSENEPGESDEME